VKATFLIAASLIVGTAAFAQQTTPAPSSSMDAASPAPAPATTATPDMTAPATTAPTPPPAPDATAPMTTGAQADSAAPAAADTSNYPPCSAAVHDRCVQTHELARQAGMSSGHHGTAHRAVKHHRKHK